MYVTFTMAEAKKQFQLGVLKGFAIARTMGVCMVSFDVQAGSGRVDGQLVDARTKEPRQFKTLDAACSALEQVGFRVDCLGGKS